MISIIFQKNCEIKSSPISGIFPPILSYLEVMSRNLKGLNLHSIDFVLGITEFFIECKASL